MKTLPIYRLGLAEYRFEHIERFLRNGLEMESYSMERSKDRVVLKSFSRELDINETEGNIWSGDQAELWNPACRPKLLDEKQVLELADDYIKKLGLLPELDDDKFSIAVNAKGGTFMALLSKEKGERQNVQLDQRVSYNVNFKIKDPDSGSFIKVPICDGFGKFGLTFGDQGKLIGYNGRWKALSKGDFQAAFIPRQEADKQFRALTKNIRIADYSAELAYKQFTDPSGRQFLYPVWAYRATGVSDEEKFPLRIITLPASEFGPEIQENLDQAVRTIPQTTLKWDSINTKRGLFTISPYEAGTSWIGTLGGLSGSKNNAQGFVDELQAIGWNINFNWGNCNAWGSDWKAEDDTWVDAADFVFYTGHADGNKWMLVNPGNCSTNWLDFSQVGSTPQTPGDRWGQQDLEWLIIAACGPLEDDILSAGGGNVLNRWDGAFDGLHLLMGYGAVTFDNEDEGRRVVQYAKEGKTLINAWFRTAQDIQPSGNCEKAPFGPTIWVGAMWAQRSGVTSPTSDHLWGFGSVAPDPTSPNILGCMWTTT